MSDQADAVIDGFAGNAAFVNPRNSNEILVVYDGTAAFYDNRHGAVTNGPYPALRLIETFRTSRIDTWREVAIPDWFIATHKRRTT
jgi:hypothetical protein